LSIENASAADRSDGNTYTHESKQRKTAQIRHSGRPLKLDQRKTAQTRPAEDRSNSTQRKAAQTRHSGRPLQASTAEDRPKHSQRKTASNSGRPLKLDTAEDRSQDNAAGSKQRKAAQRNTHGRPHKTAEDHSRHICSFSNRLEHIRAKLRSQATCNARSPTNQRMRPSAATSRISAHTSHPCRTSDRLLKMLSGFRSIPHNCSIATGFATCFGFGCGFGFGTCAARTFATTCFSMCCATRAVGTC
jgi:hypothetical protein